MIQAMIDIGSNTLRMVIYNVVDGKIEMIMKKKHLVGLAAYLKDGIMQQEGIERVSEVLLEYKNFLSSFKIKNVVAFATAALRNAKNTDEAVSEITAKTGISINIISGEKEGEYDFHGATHDIGNKEGVILDIGGASTEIVHFKEKKIISKTSIFIGSLALRNGIVDEILPSRSEIELMKNVVNEIIDDSFELYDVRCESIIGIGGTFKGASALSKKVFGSSEIDYDNLDKIIDIYQRGKDLSDKELTDILSTCSDRVHTIIPGIIIASAFMKKLGAKKILYSDSGVREGYIYCNLVSL